MSNRPEVDERTRQASRALADALRRTIARLTLVRPGAEQLERAAAAANAFADTLDALPERPPTREVSESSLRPDNFLSHSPISGGDNPIAPPLVMASIEEADAAGRFTGSIVFGPAYEGPPGHCHGGWVAAMYDELLGYVQRVPAFTAYLKVDYRRPTPLHRELELAGWVHHAEGRKLYVRGTCHVDGVLLTEAEGLFIRPREGEDYMSQLHKS
jgi:acyl-coenzyme A thioesterase PaaI-like protein